MQQFTGRDELKGHVLAAHERNLTDIRKSSNVGKNVLEFHKKQRGIKKKKDLTSPRGAHGTLAHDLTQTDASHPFYPPNFKSTEKPNESINESGISKRFQNQINADASEKAAAAHGVEDSNFESQISQHYSQNLSQEVSMVKDLAHIGKVKSIEPEMAVIDDEFAHESLPHE